LPTRAASLTADPLLSIRRDPFPFEAVRDLIGILRALYASTPPEQRERRQQIAATARELIEATELATKGGPGSMGESAAWKRAERATLRLTDLVAFMARTDELLLAAGERIRRAPKSDDERDRKRLADKLRR